MSEKITMDPYVLETLMPDLVGHDRAPSAFLVYLALWARTRRRPGRAPESAASHATLAEATGLSKSAVQNAIRRLARRRLIAIRRENATATPEYTVLRPWRRT